MYIIWDYDGPIGRINASLPYNYNENNLYQEIENVGKILDIAKEHGLKMIFAITGFSAEEVIGLDDEITFSTLALDRGFIVLYCHEKGFYCLT